jgi:RNA polymerase sigma factor (sigma-70 family)
VKLMAEREALISQADDFGAQEKAGVERNNLVFEADRMRKWRAGEQVKAERDAMRSDPEKAPIADKFDALDADHAQRQADVNAILNPQMRAIAQAALSADIGSKRQAVLDESQKVSQDRFDKTRKVAELNRVKKYQDKQGTPPADWKTNPISRGIDLGLSVVDEVSSALDPKLAAAKTLQDLSSATGIPVPSAATSRPGKDLKDIKDLLTGDKQKAQEDRDANHKAALDELFKDSTPEERAKIEGEASDWQEVQRGKRDVAVVQGVPMFSTAMQADRPKAEAALQRLRDEGKLTGRQVSSAIYALDQSEVEKKAQKLAFFKDTPTYEKIKSENPGKSDDELTDIYGKSRGSWVSVAGDVFNQVKEEFKDQFVSEKKGNDLRFLLLKGNEEEKQKAFNELFLKVLDSQQKKSDPFLSPVAASAGQVSGQVGAQISQQSGVEIATRALFALGGLVLRKPEVGWKVGGAVAPWVGMAASAYGNANVYGLTYAQVVVQDHLQAAGVNKISDLKPEQQSRMLDEAQKAFYGSQKISLTENLEPMQFLHLPKAIRGKLLGRIVDAGVNFGTELGQEIGTNIYQEAYMRANSSAHEAADPVQWDQMGGMALGLLPLGGAKFVKEQHRANVLQKTYQPRPGVNLEDVALADAEIRQSGGLNMPEAKSVAKQRDELLAQVQSEPDPARKEAIGAQIAMMDDYLRVAPVNVPRESRPDLARAMVKIAQGVPLEKLSAPERTIVSKAQTAGGVQFIDTKDGSPIITDIAREWLRGVSPKADELIGMDEATAREAAKAKNAKTQSTQAEPEPSAEGGANAPVDQPGQPAAGSTWSAAGVNGTPVSVTAASKAEAQQKLAAELDGEMLDPDSINETPAKQNETASEREAPAPQQQGPAASPTGQNAPASEGDSQTAENPAGGNVTVKRTSPNENQPVRSENVQQVPGAASENSQVLPEVSRQVDAEVEGGSPAQGGGQETGKRPGDGTRVSGQGKNPGETVQPLRESESGDASRGPQPAAGGEVGMSPVSSGASRDETGAVPARGTIKGGVTTRERWKADPITPKHPLFSVFKLARATILGPSGNRRMDVSHAETFARDFAERHQGRKFKSAEEIRDQVLKEFQESGGRVIGEGDKANENTSEEYWKGQPSQKNPSELTSPADAAEHAKNARLNRAAHEAEVHAANEALANKILYGGEAIADSSPVSQKVVRALSALPQEHRARAAKLVAKFSKALNQYGAGFDRIEIVPQSLRTAGAQYLLETKTLQLSMDDIEKWSDADMESGMQAVAGEEALHRVTTDMESAGEFNPVEFWKTLPSPMRRLIALAIKNNEGVKKYGDWARGHEAIRILLQADNEEFGRAVSEAQGIDPAWPEKFRAFLEKLVERLQSALAKLRGQNTPQAKFIQEILALAKKRAAELGILEKATDLQSERARTRKEDSSREGAETRREEGGDAKGAAPRPPKGIEGRETKIILSDGSKVAARYEVVEAGDLRPAPANDRDYSSKEERAANESRIRKFEPELILNNNPTSDTGPSIADETGEIQGGNRRFILATDERAYPAYRAALEGKSADFGIDAEKVKGMDRPILIRRILGDARDLNRELNNSAVGDISMIDNALSAQRVMTEDVAREAAVLFSEHKDKSPLQVLSQGDTSKLAAAMREAGMIRPNEKSKYTFNGRLNDEGARLARYVLLAKVVPDKAVLSRIGDTALEGKLISSVPAVMRMAMRGVDISPMLDVARAELDRLSVKTGKREMTVAEYQSQGTLDGIGIVPIGVQELQRIIGGLPSMNIKKAMNLLANVIAPVDPAQGSLGGGTNRTSISDITREEADSIIAGKQPEGTGILFSGKSVAESDAAGYNAPSERTDPHTGRATFISGASYDEGRRADDARTNERVLGQIKSVLADAAQGRRSGESDREAITRASRDLGYSPVDPEFLGNLKRLKSGSEADVYHDEAAGVVYKIFIPSPSGEVGWRLRAYKESDGSWRVDREPATLSDTLQKLALLHEAGGLPTEILGITETGDVLAKQPMAEETEAGTQTRAEAVVAMNGVQTSDAELDGIRVFWAQGKAWFLGDLHGQNIMRDASGQTRVMDALMLEVPGRMIDENPAVAKAVRLAIEKAEGTQEDSGQGDMFGELLFSTPRGIAPNGKKSNLTDQQWEQVRTPEFKRWFGDWQAVAEEKAFEDAIDSVVGGTWDMTKPILIGSTPDVMLVSGADQLPITMPPSMVKKVTVEEHDLPIGIVRQIAKAIKDPVFVLQSAKIHNALVVILDLKHNGESVMVAVHLNRKEGQHEVNRIASIYDKSNPRAVEGWIKAGLLRYSHQGKSRAWFRSRGLQLPKEGSIRGNKTIRTETDVVNRNVNPDSVSKVVDENGEPLAVYHGGIPFDVMESKEERGQDSYNGLFLTNDKNVAEGYSFQTDNGAVQSFFVSAKRVYDVRDVPKGDFAWEFPEPSKLKNRPDALKDSEIPKQGYDAKIGWVDNYRGHPQGHESWEIEVYKPGAVKSATDNNGQFNPENPSILSSTARQGVFMDLLTPDQIATKQEQNLFAWAGKQESEIPATEAKQEPQTVIPAKTEPEEPPAATQAQEATIPEKSSEPTPGAIEDFGTKLGGARKDKQASIESDISDEDISSKPLSEIWPKAEVDAIEDTQLAAVATAIRSEVPAKPRKGYKLERWVETVKLVRGLMRHAEEKGFDEILRLMDEKRLENFTAKIRLLSAIPRETWGRIGDVRDNPKAMRFVYDADRKPVIGEDGRQKTESSPYSSAQVDSGSIRASSLTELAEKVTAATAEEKTSPKMEFQVRGRSGSYFINKKGDPLYRHLKEFTDSKEALDFVRSNHGELVKAWEDVKESDNVKERDLRTDSNRPRTGADHRGGRDVTSEMFQKAFGFRGVEFGNWVSQGENARERQGMLNQAFDALHDLAAIIGVPPRAVSLNGELGLGFGSRGKGGFAAAHYEPGTIVINLTKTKGAGTLAHEWFHALDHYFQRQRNSSGVYSGKGDYITGLPEAYYVGPEGQRLPESRYNELMARPYNASRLMNWKRVEGVRPAVLEAFNDLVKALDASPMAKRAELIDKGKSDGYWSRIIERAARAFENYTIFKMAQQGYHNDYLANVVPAEDFSRDMGRYPYLLDSEMKPVAEAFDNLFGTVQTRETEKGVALYSTARETAKKYVSGLDLPRNIQHEAEREIRVSLEEIDRLRETYDLFGDETFGSKAEPELFASGNQGVSPQTGDRSLQSGEVSEEEYSRLVESGLKGDWEALGQAVAARGTASSIFKELVGGNMPVAWDIVGTKIESPADFAALLMPLRSPYVESLKVAVLDDNNRVVSQHIISVGSLNESIAHPREIFGPLARLRAVTGKNFTRIIIGHNHPSGDPAPSGADRRLTTALNEGAELMGFTILDHVITNGQKFFSFLESGAQNFHAETGGKAANISKKLERKAPAWDAVKDKLAPWERIQRLDLALADGSQQHKLQNIIAGLRQADPASGHLIALNTKMRIIGVRRVSGMLEKTNAEVFREVFKMATEEGAYAFAVHMPGERSKRTDDMRRGLREGASLAQIHFVDSLTVDADGRIESAAESGLMEDATEYGKRVLASTDRRQQMLDLGMYSNPGELDFSKTAPKQTPGELVTENIGLANSLAQKYFNVPNVENDDVIQQARKGLVRAARAFDPAKGKFSSFAWRVIQNELNDLYGRQMKVATNEAVSLDEPIGRDSAGNDATRYDVMPDRTERGPLGIEREETAAIIKSAVDSLPEQPRTIVRMSMQGLDGEEIAAKLGISRQRVNLVLQNAHAILRKKLTQQGLRGQEGGVLFSTGRGDGSVEELLAELRRDMPSLAEIEAFRQRANAEPKGARTIGVPAKAKYSPDEETRRATDVVQQLREDRMARETEDGWISEAEGMLKRDREGVKKTLLQKALDPAKYGTFTATEVKAAQILVPELMRRAFREKSLALRKEAFALAWAYDAGGSEQARAFSARRDPFKSPAERHTEFLTKIVSTPTAEQRKHIDAAPDAKERQSRLEAAQNERLDKIEKALAGMGIKLEDIFSGEAYVRLKGAAMVENAMGAYDAKKRKAIRLIQDQFPDSEISRVTGLSVSEINALEKDISAKLAERMRELVKQGVDIKNIDFESLFSSARNESNNKMSDAEIERQIAENLRAMGFGRAETRNKKELIKRRKPKRRYPVQSYDGPVPSDDPVQAEKLRQQGLEWDENRQAWNRNPKIPGNEPLPTEAMKQERIRYDTDQPWEYVKFDPANKDQVIRAARIMQAADSNVFDMIIEGWMNGLLSGPATHVANITGNGAMAMLEYSFQRWTEAAVNTLPFVKDPNSATFGELKHIYRSAMPGIMKGYQAAIRAFASEHDFFENDVLNSQLEFNDFDKGGGGKAAIPGKIGRVVRVMTRSLMAMDAFFKYATGQMEAAGQAYRIALAQGFTGEKMESEMRSQMEPGSMAWQRAVLKAKELTFQQDVPGIVQGIMALRKGWEAKILNKTVPGGDFPGNQLFYTWLKMQLPFIKTVYNIFRTGIRKSPLGLANMGWQIAKGLYSIKNGRPFVDGYPKAMFVRDAAEQLLAFGATALLMGAIEGDDDDDKKWLLITGGRPYGVDNQGERDLLDRTSGGQYQIRIGGRNGFYFNYGRVEPWATTLGTVATGVRLAKSGKGPDDWINRMIANLASQATDKTFMQSLNNMFGTVDALRSKDGAYKFAQKSVQGFLSSFVPNIIKQPLRSWDDYVRDGKYSDKGYKFIPIGNLAEPRSDIYGKPVQKQGNAVSRLFFPSGVVPTPVLERGDQFLQSYNRTAEKPYTPERPRNYKLKNAKGQWVAMTPQQIAGFDRKSGILFAVKLKSWLTPYAIEHPTEEHKKQFEDDLATARSEVKSRMFPVSK